MYITYIYTYTSICIFTTVNIHHLFVRFDEASIRYSLQASEASVKDADPGLKHQICLQIAILGRSDKETAQCSTSQYYVYTHCIHVVIHWAF